MAWAGQWRSVRLGHPVSRCNPSLLRLRRNTYRFLAADPFSLPSNY